MVTIIWDPPPSVTLPTPPRGASAPFRAPAAGGVVWKTANMQSERAQLSSATTTLEELLDRVSSTAESVLASGDESLASDLFEVERSLRTAHRRLVAATRRAG